MSSPILAIVGPTASGKTALAIEIARRLNGEIVNCDAMQIYRECDVVTAKPTVLEREAVPHHLINICAPDEQFSAPQWARAATDVIEDIASRGKTPIICGGTGFYLRALMEPERLSAPAPDDSLRVELEARLDKEGAMALITQLQKLAPDIAAKLEPNDGYRVVRALQIALQRARGDAANSALSPIEARVFALQWPRDLLYTRINTRVNAMLEANALDETRALLDKWGRYAPWASGVGYVQLLDVLEDQRPLDDAVRDWKQASRRYAKRQQTWFRHQTNATWLDATQDLTDLADLLISATESAEEHRENQEI